MPSPEQAWLRLPSIHRNQPDDIRRNLLEMERWANHSSPIFPLYEINRQGYTGSILNSSASWAKLKVPNNSGGTGVNLEMVVSKKHDWTVLRVDVVLGGYLNGVGVLLEVQSVIDDMGVVGSPYSSQLTRFYSNVANVHTQVIGSSETCHAVPAGQHLVSVMFRNTPGGNIFVIDNGDIVIMRVQECPPPLRSGEKW